MSQYPQFLFKGSGKTGLGNVRGLNRRFDKPNMYFTPQTDFENMVCLSLVNKGLAKIESVPTSEEKKKRQDEADKQLVKEIEKEMEGKVDELRKSLSELTYWEVCDIAKKEGIETSKRKKNDIIEDIISKSLGE